MKNVFLLISCLGTLVSGTLRHFDHSAPDAAVVSPEVAPAPATHSSFAVQVVEQEPLLPRLTLPVWVLGADATARQLLQQPAATAADCRRAYAAQYAGTPRLTLAMHPTARHFLLDDAPAWCWQQLDQVLVRYCPAPHPRA